MSQYHNNFIIVIVTNNITNNIIVLGSRWTIKIAELLENTSSFHVSTSIQFFSMIRLFLETEHVRIIFYFPEYKMKFSLIQHNNIRHDSLFLKRSPLHKLNFHNIFFLPPVLKISPNISSHIANNKNLYPKRYVQKKSKKTLSTVCERSVSPTIERYKRTPR